MNDSAFIKIFSGNGHWNKQQWQLSWETKDRLNSLDILIPRKSDKWTKDWVNLVTQGFPGSTNYSPANNSKNSQTVTLIDRIPVQEILCNTVLTCVDPQALDSTIVSRISDQASEEEIIDILQSIADNYQVQQICLEFYARILEPGSFGKVFKSEREKLQSEMFNRKILVTMDKPIVPWNL